MPQPMQAHPSSRELECFVLGKMSEAESAEIEDHLTRCPACQDTLRRREPSDTLVGMIQQSATTVEPMSPADLDLGSTTAYVPQREKEGRLPETFGRYQIKECLGKGGMGAVYLARDTKLDREVALKVPRIDGNDRENQALLERFHREARAMGEFRHPNLCPIYDVDQFNGVHFYTMPFISGISLQSWLKKHGRLSPVQTAGLIRKLALGLLEAHRRGVIHRDLKPSNVMIEKTGRGTHEPIVVDFGLARREKGPDIRLTRSGSPMGTPAYMPPEQLLGELDQVGVASDIYSLGATMYELLTGQLPFNRQNWAALSNDILHKPPTSPSEINPEVDERLAGICLKCLAKKPEDRYASMQELAMALEDYLSNRSSTASVKRPSAGPASRSMLLRPLGDALRNALLGAWENRGLVLVGLALVGGTLILLAGIVIVIETSRGERIRIESPAKEVRITVQETNGTEGPLPAKPPVEPPQPAAKPALPPQDDPGWKPLFNGRDLTGWHVENKTSLTGASSWRVVNGVIEAYSPDFSQRSYLMTTRRFRNFVLSFDFMVDSSSHGGVALRGEPGESVPYGSINIFDHPIIKLSAPGRDPKDSTGASHWLKDGRPHSLPFKQPTIQPEVWYRIVITVDGKNCEATLDGQKMIDFTLDPDRTTYNGISPGLEREGGQVGFQINTGKVRFRNITLRELPSR